MSLKLDICNLALGHLAVGKTIANLETERSQEALACKLFFPIAFESFLRSRQWGFAKKIKALSLVEEDPNDDWAYSYAYPNDCIEVRRLLSGTRADTLATRVPWERAYGDDNPLIFTDQADAQVEYTTNFDSLSRLPADAALALSYLLASMVAPRITGGDQFKLGDKALQKYSMFHKAAAAKDANERQRDPEPDSETILARS